MIKVQIIQQPTHDGSPTIEEIEVTHSISPSHSVRMLIVPLYPSYMAQQSPNGINPRNEHEMRLFNCISQNVTDHSFVSSRNNAQRLTEDTTWNQVVNGSSTEQKTEGGRNIARPSDDFPMTELLTEDTTLNQVVNGSSSDQKTEGGRDIARPSDDWPMTELFERGPRRLSAFQSAV